ncbi:MAG: hypothetical protein J0I06_14350 [Planctomycetes bacterium]|nr:hypothetical protein [Planctomycetota bacterium]
MFRNAILAVALAAGAGTAASAFSPMLREPVPNSTGIEGRWFMSGDPRQPTFIQLVPGRGGPALLLTNERGERSRGRILPGRRIIADDWANGLIGDVRNDEIFWRNGDRWAR